MKDSKAVEGEMARFDVKMKGEPSPDVVWYHGKDKIVDGGKFKVIKSEKDQKYSLIIEDLTTDDAGLYKCVALNEAGKTMEQANLVVKEKPIAPEFEGKQHIEPMVIEEGNEVNMSINIKGKPKPEIKWYKNNKPLSNTSKVELRSVGDEYKLKIKTATPADSGTYKCEAKNEAGTSFRTFDLKVEGKDNIALYVCCHLLQLT
jgi:membrane carboxypeptidase/penicillin-binding protein PbpC